MTAVIGTDSFDHLERCCPVGARRLSSSGICSNLKPRLVSETLLAISCSLHTTFECRAIISAHRTKNLVDAALVATGDADREQAAFFALHYRSL